MIGGQDRASLEDTGPGGASVFAMGFLLGVATTLGAHRLETQPRQVFMQVQIRVTIR